ncbi:STAG domain-containing protein [Colletotrichum karsti]|uniref:STAG domain-containing protein n=1 Tax=Colletotrichum karsti TaxID=1095194 RepID=A0A9P6HSB9_9PEZI|nr:STAG domain-containing protein [Colletotrichum karsti]KAF9869478.1 STAG domain-containing protein [Colletotrichum karsti]
MESATASPEPESSSRRRSGRVVRAPEKFSPEPVTAPKRKRGSDHDEDDEENDEDGALSDATMSDGDTADERPRPRPKKRSTAQGNRARKPATKKPKTNGVAPSGHSASLPSRPKKTVRIAAVEKQGEGLYADVFGSGLPSEHIADKWQERYQANDALAVVELVNLVLQASGCDLQISEDDVRDPDNCQARLTELQDLFQEARTTHDEAAVSIEVLANIMQEQVTEYPLISRAKNNRVFRDLLINFFRALVRSVHDTDVLYNDHTLMENLVRWIASMSTSSLRPFRHTATTVILSLVHGLIDVAKTLDDRIGSTEQQVTQAKKGKNKAKLAEMQHNLDEANHSRELCSHHIKDFFDTTFIHRYRDIDPRIRTECVEALGSWIIGVPTLFMQPEYLRYLGWMLSDTVASTRQEVLRQLARIFKRGISQLGHFIDRFRPRLIEIATKDAEVSVRVAAISVINVLRDAGMLEPEEMDTIGKLIYDSDIRVRKAVVSFFVACVEDFINNKVEELGGQDALDELFGEIEDDDYESPRGTWVNIKCLAETLAAYDEQVEGERPDANSQGLAVAADVLQANVPDTRISLAAQVLFEKVPFVKEWEVLSGYLLYDHTVSSKSRSKSTSTETAFKKAVGPVGSEEAILLEVLATAVKMLLLQSAELEKARKRGGRSEITEAHEDTALDLAVAIPRLLNKFGADPATATIVLRMEHFLDLEVFQILRQDSSKYEKLLDEISTQFNRHGDKRVIAEAAAALLHSRQCEELEELTDGKLAVLWENVINTLRGFDKTCELSIRGNLEEEHLTALSTVLMKISELARISDPVEVLETEGRAADSMSSPIEILINIANRGTFDDANEDLEDLEDEVASFAIKATQFYFMWKVKSLEKLIQSGTEIPDSVVDSLSVLRKNYDTNLIKTLSSRAVIDDTRLFAAGALCDVHVLFGTLRSLVEPTRGTAMYRKLAGLVRELEPRLLPELVSIYDGIEKGYAKKTKKLLNEPADDEEPMDDDDSDEEEDDDEVLSHEERLALELKSEKALCELAAKYVLAIVQKVLDQTGPHAGKLRKRLLRNQTRLGKNFSEVVAFLDEKKIREHLSGKKQAQRSKATSSKPASKKPSRSEEMVVDDDDEEEEPLEEPEAEPEEGSREDLLRRELLEEEEEEEPEPEEAPINHDVEDDDNDVLGD